MEKVMWGFACLGIFTWIFAIVPAVYPHAASTHQNITRAAVEYLQSIEPAFNDISNLESVLQIGAVAEDDTPKFMFHFLPRLDRGLAFASCSSLDWGFVDMECEQNLPKTQRIQTNTHTWNDAITNAPGEAGLVDLGYVIHLLEDLTSPAHTRNDPHPPGIDGDPFELYNSGAIPETPRGDSGLISFSTPQEFFTALQEHTQSNFYSADTDFRQPFKKWIFALNDYF
jgi:hypothetical protein